MQKDRTPYGLLLGIGDVITWRSDWYDLSYWNSYYTRRRLIPRIEGKTKCKKNSA